MAGTLANVLLFVAVISLALILITILDWVSHLPIFHPSRPDVQNLLTSLEDLLLPMGSVSSELLHPWTPKELSHESNQTTLPLSMTPAPESGRSDLGWQSPITKATHHDGGVKPFTELSPTTSIILNGDTNSTMILPSALPTPNVDKSEPSAELPMSAQAIINCGSISETTFALMLSPPDDEGSNLSAMSRWTRRQTGNGKENAGDEHYFTNPATSGDRGLVLDYASDQASSDSTRGQQSLKEISCDTGSAVDVPLPEQTLAEIDALGTNSENMNEEVQKDQKPEEEDGIAAAEEVSTESKAPEQQDENSTATVEKVSIESQAFEVAIRGLVDPDGSSGSSLDDLVTLVANVSKGRAEAEEKLKSEIIRFNKEEEDQGVESDRLSTEKSRLDRENSELKQKLRHQKNSTSGK